MAAVVMQSLCIAFFHELLILSTDRTTMSGTTRKSDRLRKPITTIDQNLDDEDDSNDAFVAPKPRKTVSARTSVKRPSTDDNDEQDMITPKKRQRKKPSTTATKTSPYFEKKADAPKPKAKKPAKPKGKKSNVSFDENTTMSTDAASVTTKSKTTVSPRCRRSPSFHQQPRAVTTIRTMTTRVGRTFKPNRAKKSSFKR